MKQMLAFPVVVASLIEPRKAALAGSLTYPPEIIVESTVELPPEYGRTGGCELTEAHFDLALFVIVFVVQFVVELQPNR